MAHGLQVVTIQQVQSFDQRGSLRPEAGLVNLVAVIISFHRRPDPRVKAREVLRREQAAVVLHVVANAAGDRALVKIVARSH